MSYPEIIWNIFGALCLSGLAILIFYVIRNLRRRRLWLITLVAVCAYLSSIIGMILAFQGIELLDAFMALPAVQYSKSPMTGAMRNGFLNFHIHSLIFSALMIILTYLPAKTAGYIINRRWPDLPAGTATALALGLTAIWLVLPMLESWIKKF